SAGYFVNPAVTFGADIKTPLGTLTPSLRLRYTALLLDGYSESGSGDGLVVDARAVHEVDLRAQLALALTPIETEQGAAAATVRAGADIVHRQGDAISGKLMGADIGFASPGDGTRYGGFAALDLEIELTGGAVLRGSLEAGLDTASRHSVSAKAGISGAF